MKIVDENNWDAELEIMLKKQKELQIFKGLLYIAQVICIMIICIGIAVTLQSVMFAKECELVYWIEAIGLMFLFYIRKYRKRVLKIHYNIENLVFCIINEQTFIDAEYQEKERSVKITFWDDMNQEKENILVNCDVFKDPNIAEDTLYIHPNNALLILQAEKE